MNQSIDSRYEIVYLFDVKDGNPNGDPDAGNQPRMDPETGNGLVTDVCLKRKIRNYVQMVKGAKDPFDIFIKEHNILNKLIAEAHEQENVKNKEKGDKTESAREFMCGKYYDIRTFGAVMTTGKNAGQVRGPVQLTFSRSIDPIVAFEHRITRMAVATEAEAEIQNGENHTMGSKFTVPYGLYRCHGFISASLAKQTGFGQEDLDLFWEALKNMFEHDRSAARGYMVSRKLYVFRHDSEVGNAPSHKLFELVKVARKKDGKLPPRCFEDYEVWLDGEVPEGVKLIEML